MNNCSDLPLSYLTFCLLQQAQIYYAGKSRYIGVFEDKGRASLAYEVAREVIKMDKKGDVGPVKADEEKKNVDLARKAAFLGVSEFDGQAYSVRVSIPKKSSAKKTSKVNASEPPKKKAKPSVAASAAVAPPPTKQPAWVKLFTAPEPTAEQSSRGRVRIPSKKLEFDSGLSNSKLPPKPKQGNKKKQSQPKVKTESKSTARKEKKGHMWGQSNPQDKKFATYYHHPKAGDKEASVPAEPAEGLPDGWVTRRIKRNSMGVKTAPAKTSDLFFYSPKENFKFRSRPEVQHFLESLVKTDGDEPAAMLLFKKCFSSKTPPKTKVSSSAAPHSEKGSNGNVENDSDGAEMLLKLMKGGTDTEEAKMPASEEVSSVGETGESAVISQSTTGGDAAEEGKVSENELQLAQALLLLR